MSYRWLIVVLVIVMVYNVRTKIAEDALGWQEVYVVNNSGYDLEIAADVSVLSNINDVVHVTHPVYKMTWFIPKKKAGKGGTVKLDALNLLHNITVKPQVEDQSLLPEWMQKPYNLVISERTIGKTLIIYIAVSKTHWIIQQRYVEAVKIDFGGPSGYTVTIDQV